MKLRDAIDKDLFIIDDNQFTDADLQKMSVDELETLKMRINTKISGISASLKEKQIDYANGGKGTTKDWYMTRKYALSINQRALTYINTVIKKRRRTGRSISDLFMDQAKIVLPSREYEQILNSAQIKFREGSHGSVQGN